MSLQDLPFVQETLIKDINLEMSGLVPDSFFATIPINKTFDVCMRKLFRNAEILDKQISKNYSHNLLNFATNNQVLHSTGVVMESPLGPMKAKNFLFHHEENWLHKYLVVLNWLFTEGM